MMNYQLKPIGKVCAATEKPLEPGAIVQSIVIEENGILVRCDYSEEGWEGVPEGAIGHWESKVPDDNAPPKRKLDTESLMEYFEQLLEEANPLQQKFCYVLSLLLVQKRRLKIDGTRIDGEIKYLELSGNRGEGPYEVRDQNLTNEEIAMLQNEMNQHIAA